jgi:glycine/D-amino acid oxidase-like deaminating enzyme
MGSCWALPADTDINALCRTPVGRMMAKAARDYGGHIVDQGGTSGPSQWSVQGGVLRQDANIGDGDGSPTGVPKLGTVALLPPLLVDQELVARVRTDDNDAIGVVLRWQDGQNHYRFSLDAERGYVLAPMQRGLRLTTGAEFAPIDALPTPVQLAKAEALARELVDLGESLPEAPWLGARPCTADMLPVIGPAPRHKGLWFNFGHAHQGFTMGPVAGRLLAEMVSGEPPCVDPMPYLPRRFG